MRRDGILPPVLFPSIGHGKFTGSFRWGESASTKLERMDRRVKADAARIPPPMLPEASILDFLNKPVGEQKQAASGQEEQTLPPEKQCTTVESVRGVVKEVAKGAGQAVLYREDQQE
ncbi:hypothetical protein NDU88_005462 [Pleurodeles waltl]|uniref:Uncharacterized protein n=1 Tax=Pleurodeles waltl TaxID=8319 RepID=A0AAV7TVH7_PLEWA|nr:hypothetical protein NDU88_005462 [Pleurodeles waltl]